MWDSKSRSANRLKVWTNADCGCGGSGPSPGCSYAREDIVATIVAGSTHLTACLSICMLLASARGLPIWPILPKCRTMQRGVHASMPLGTLACPMPASMGQITSFSKKNPNFLEINPNLRPSMALAAKARACSQGQGSLVGIPWLDWQAHARNTKIISKIFISDFLWDTGLYIWILDKFYFIFYFDLYC